MGGRSRRSTLQAWGYYLLALMAWVTIVLVVSVLGFIICRSLIWYETNPLYQLLNWVRDYYFFVFAFVILVGWVVISYYFIARPNQQLQALIQASGQLSRPTEEPIRLPPAMKSVEDQLNLAREEALRAQQAAREAEQRKNDLVVYLAHDLKTPGRAPDLPGAAGAVHRHRLRKGGAAGGPDQRIFRHHPLQPEPPGVGEADGGFKPHAPAGGQRV